MSDRTTLIKIMDVIGKNIFKSGFEMMISPGSRPNGMCFNQGQRSPAMRMINPIVIKVFCMTLVY